MTLPDAESLARQLPSLPHVERVRALVRLARDHAADPALGALLDGLAARSDYHAGLALAAARAVGDAERVRALSHGAVPGTDDLATRYLSLPLEQRRALEHRIRATRRTDMAAILLGLPLADADRARLLASADEPTARSLIADLGDLLPSLAPLARRHPGVVLDELARRLEGATPVQRDSAWAWARTAYAPLAARLPGGLIALLLTVGPTRVVPHGLDPHLGRLLRHDPTAVGALLARAPHDVGQRHLTTASARLIKSLHRALHLLTVPERIALARAGRDDDGRLAAILAALPPRDREEVLDGALDGIDTTRRHYSEALLEVLPRDRRQHEAQRMAALPESASALPQLVLAGFLPPDQAILQAGPRLHALGAEERAQAWAALIGSAGRSRDADALTEVLLRLGALDHEQDAVRLVVARELASIPLSILARCPLTPLEGFIRAALRAQDASSATQWTLQGLAWALTDHALATGNPPTGPARLLQAAVGDEPRLWHPPLTPGRALASAAVEALAKRLAEESVAGECGLLLDLHSALGRQANGDPCSTPSSCRRSTPLSPRTARGPPSPGWPTPRPAPSAWPSSCAVTSPSPPCAPSPRPSAPCGRTSSRSSSSIGPCGAASGTASTPTWRSCPRAPAAGTPSASLPTPPPCAAASTRAPPPGPSATAPWPHSRASPPRPSRTCGPGSTPMPPTPGSPPSRPSPT
ncbi:hypothetical protein [Actinomyces denticolens]|uniref:hypothetical protein n=1 Tax=Actinomyces denticolens TaxID=52767 RepID=UPI000981B84F|nr:hypothetical protein [Actinomyces denticolens]